MTLSVIKQKLTKELYEVLKEKESKDIRFELVTNVIDIYLDKYRNIEGVCGSPIAEIEFVNGIFTIRSYITHKPENIERRNYFKIFIPMEDETDVFSFVEWYKTLLNKRIDFNG